MSEEFEPKPLEPFVISGCEMFGITLSQFKIDEEDHFNVIIDLYLNTGKDDHFVSVITEIWDTCPHCAAKKGAMIGVTFSEHFRDDIYIFGEDGNEFKPDGEDFEHKVSDLLEEVDQEMENAREEFKVPEGTVLH